MGTPVSSVTVQMGCGCFLIHLDPVREDLGTFWSQKGDRGIRLFWMNPNPWCSAWTPGTLPVPSPHLHLPKPKVRRGRCYCVVPNCLSGQENPPSRPLSTTIHPSSAPCARPGFSLCGETRSKQLHLALTRAVTPCAVSPIDLQPHSPISHPGFVTFGCYKGR